MYPALNECSDEAYIQKAIHTNFEESQPQFPFEYALFHISSENDSYGQWNCQSFRRANFIIKPTCSTSHKECDSFMDVVRNINAPHFDRSSYIIAVKKDTEKDSLTVHQLKLPIKRDQMCCIKEWTVGENEDVSAILWRCYAFIFYDAELSSVYRPRPTLSAAYFGDGSLINRFSLFVFLAFSYPCADFWSHMWGIHSQYTVQSIDFWGLIAPFAFGRLIRIMCTKEDALIHFSRLHESIKVTPISNDPYTHLNRFLTPMDMNDYGLARPIVKRYFLPHVKDFQLFYSSCRSDFILDMVHDRAFLIDLADTNPRFITTLFDDPHFFRACLADIAGVASQNGEIVYKEWLDVTLPLYRNCQYQMGVPMRKRNSRFEALRRILPHTVPAEIMPFDEPRPRSLAATAKRAVLCLLRQHLNRDANRANEPPCCLSKFLSSMEFLPARLTRYLLTINEE